MTGTPFDEATNDALPGSGVMEMFMQPITDLVTGQAVTFESLARLRLVDDTVVAAAMFVPGLSGDAVDRLFVTALDLSLHSLAHWRKLGIAVDISVNVDPHTLAHPRCGEWVAAALHRHRVAPVALTLEVLETAPLDRSEQRIAIDRIHDTGVRLAIDDRGSGHSTVDRLRSFDFDVVKIDASAHAEFARLPTETLESLSSLIAVGNASGRPLVVEGLETLDILGVVAVLGATYGQGYVIARPMPAVDVPAWTADAQPLVDLERLTTFSAALAFHWRSRRGGQHPGPTSSCCITELLACVPEDGSATRWHRDQHGPTTAETRASGQELHDWLASHVIAGT